MINDEFTNLKSNNDSFIKKTEFGNLPDSEFSDAGEMNLHKAAYDPSLMKSQNSQAESASQTTASSSSAAVETTAVSSSAATGIAATSAGIITVASTVAIGALGVFAVVSSTHDYQVVLDSTRIIGDSLSYSIAVYDKNMNEQDYEEYFNERYQKMDSDQFNEEDIEYPFVIKLYNLSYSSTNHADYLYNEGSFQHVTVGETYTIEVSESRFGGDILYETTFIASYSNYFNSVSFPVNVDLEKGTFDIYLDYVDDADAFSDFTLYLYDLEVPEEINYTFELEKMVGYQTIIGPNSTDKIDVFKDWGYKFSYKENGEVVDYIEDIAQFNDMYGRKSGFYEFVFDKTISIKERTMDVRLDFDNDFGWYSNFLLTWYIHHGNDDDPTSQPYVDDREIELELTTDTQTISIEGLDFNYLDDTLTYTYVLTCEYRGETIEVAREDTAFKLTDNSGAKSEWNKFIFDKTADFYENTFEVQLDYVDDFNYYDNFTLTLLPSGVNAQYDFHLDATSEVQTCTFDAQQHWNYSFDYEYSYSLTCAYQGAMKTLDSGENFKFTDNSGFHSFIFDSHYDYGDGTFNVRLDYEDPNNNFANFVMHIASEDDPENPNVHINLASTTETQTISMSDYNLEAHAWYYYTLTCDYKGNEVTLAKSEESFEFYDPDIAPQVSITFINNEMNWATGTIAVQLDYTDKYNMLNGVYLRFYGKANEDQDDYFNESDDIWLEQNEDPQEINISAINTGEDDGIDYIKYNLAYNLYWEYYSDVDTDTGVLFSDPQPITLINSAKTEVSGYESKFQVFPERDATAGYDKYRMYIKFDAKDENSIWSSYKAYWEGVNSENGSTFQQAVIEFDENTLDGWHKITIQCEGENDAIFNGEGWDLVVIADVNNPYTGYTATDEEIYRIENTKPVYVSAPDPEILDVSFSDSVISNGDDNYALTAFPMFAGEETQYTDVQFIFEKEDGSTYTYSIDSFSNYLDFIVNNPDEGSIDVSNDFENVPFTISVRYRTSTGGVTSELITKVVATNKKFGVSV